VDDETWDGAVICGREGSPCSGVRVRRWEVTYLKIDRGSWAEEMDLGSSATPVSGRDVLVAARRRRVAFMLSNDEVQSSRSRHGTG